MTTMRKLVARVTALACKYRIKDSPAVCIDIPLCWIRVSDLSIPVHRRRHEPCSRSICPRSACRLYIMLPARALIRVREGTLTKTVTDLERTFERGEQPGEERKVWTKHLGAMVAGDMLRQECWPVHLHGFAAVLSIVMPLHVW